jgi:glycine cleavage system transcriptional repressor
MGSLVAVTVIGNDRPGIVAAVTKSLYESGCNLEDVSSTILRGHFSMVMIVRTGGAATALEAGLSPIAQDMDLVITARPVEDTNVEVVAPTHMVSVYGADKPGIVYRVAEVLAASGANVTDLTSRVIGDPSDPVYALMLEVSVAEDTDPASALEGLKEELGVDVSVHPIEPDLL